MKAEGAHEKQDNDLLVLIVLMRLLLFRGKVNHN